MTSSAFLAASLYIDPFAKWSTVVMVALIKPLTYVAFTVAFFDKSNLGVRSNNQIFVRIASLRALLGTIVVGSTAWWFLHRSGSDEWWMGYVILTVERIALWAAIGYVLGRLRGDQLITWALSGTFIDFVFDVSFAFGLAGGGWVYACTFAIILPFLRFTAVCAMADPTESAVPLCPANHGALAANVSRSCSECGPEIEPAPLPRSS